MHSQERLPHDRERTGEFASWFGTTDEALECHGEQNISDGFVIGLSQWSRPVETGGRDPG